MRAVLRIHLHRRLAQRSIEEIELSIISALASGIAGSDVRAGVIGEIGVNGQTRADQDRTSVMTAAEERGLRAAARASLRTGVPIVVHQPNRPEAPALIAGVLEDEGVPPDRVCLGHMSSVPGVELHAEMISRGYWIGYDNFGMEIANRFVSDTSDESRVAKLSVLLRDGLGDHVLLSHDTWSKIQLSRFGGGGYTHVIAKVLPELIMRGATERDASALLSDNPRRFFRVGALCRE